MNSSTLAILTWVCIGGLAYIYAGYPLLIWLLARVCPRPVRKQPRDEKCSVVIAAYNEAERLPAKLRRLLSSDNAPWIREIIVASDGSTDGTAAAVRTLDAPVVHLIEFPERRGKPAVLNDVVPRCQSDIVVFTDARQELASGALSGLLANFADASVGVVSGELLFRAAADEPVAAQGVGTYWRYEKFIRRCEALYKSVPGATGALYALRKTLFRPMPAQTLVDDVVLPMQAVMQGYRCVFEGGAHVFDEPSREPGQEATRKRRTIAGIIQLIGLFPSWLLPWRNPIWFSYVSHKLGRLLSPWLLLGLAVSTVPLAGRCPFSWIVAAQGLLYLGALIGWLAQRGRVRLPLVGVPLMFVTMNITTLMAWADALRGRYTVQWTRFSS